MRVEPGPRARVAQAGIRALPPGAPTVLGAAAGLYRGLLASRDWLYRRGVLRSRAIGVPVVSVGNLVVGGTGKTPAVELAVQTLRDLGHRPAIVSRGYRRATRGVRIVADTAAIRLDADDAGDEPFLLARRLPGVPVVVGASRHDAACRAVERFGATAIVLDDAFQHRTLVKDLEIVMVRAHDPWGNGRLLPGGPLREPRAALRRAHLVLATGVTAADEVSAVTAEVHRWAPDVPVLPAAYVPTECWESASRAPAPLERLRGLRTLAFAGIGSPATFGRTLAGLGTDVAELVAFGDHHRYSRGDLERLAHRAADLGAAAMVTTEKDWVRLRRLAGPDRPLYVLAVRLVLVGGEQTWQATFTRACRRR